MLTVVCLMLAVDSVLLERGVILRKVSIIARYDSVAARRGVHGVLASLLGVLLVLNLTLHVITCHLVDLRRGGLGVLGLQGVFYGVYCRNMPR